MRRVVVTGLGPLTPIGVGAEAYHRAQLEGKSGVRPITRFDASVLPVRIAAEVDVNPEDYLDKKELRRLDRFVQYALIAAELALKDAGLEPSALDPERVGTLVGTGIGGMETWEAQSKVFLERGPNRISPFFIPMMIANMASAHIAMRYGFMGPSSTAVTACATGSDAIGQAFRMVQLGEADVVLAGGTEAAITPMAIGAFAVMRALSTRNEEPTKASRPFTLSRDGFVMGEGAGVLVLEEYEHARRRGARIYAEVVGFGRSADAHHITEPHPEGKGAALAMRRALRDAQVNPEAVGYINAHGTSTPVGDRAEVLAIKEVFGAHAKRLMVSSTKSMIGHLLGAAGAVEAIATVQALHHGVIPPHHQPGRPRPGAGPGLRARAQGGPGGVRPLQLLRLRRAERRPPLPAGLGCSSPGSGFWNWRRKGSPPMPKRPRTPGAGAPRARVGLPHPLPEGPGPHPAHHCLPPPGVQDPGLPQLGGDYYAPASPTPSRWSRWPAPSPAPWASTRTSRGHRPLPRPGPPPLWPHGGEGSKRAHAGPRGV